MQSALEDALAPGPPEALPQDWPLAKDSYTAAIAPYRWHIAAIGDGPEMLMLHGAGASAHSWGGLAPLLAKTNRVLAPDLPGHGLTRARGMRAGLPAMTADLLGLMRGLGARPRVLVGHSAGGALALSMARRLDPKPRAVIILNGALENFQGLAGVMFPVMAKMLALNPFAAPFLARSGGNPGAVERVIGSTGSTLPPAAISHYRRLIRDRRHVSGTLSMMAAWSLQELSRALPEIDVPVLFLHGALDEAVRPDVARRAVSVMPNASLQVIDDLGHLIHEEAPEEIATRIRAYLKVLP